MQQLIELTGILNKRRLSKIDVLDKTFLNNNNDNMYFRLYNAIVQKQVKTDDEAAKVLYGATKKDARYKMLKSRFRNKLLKSVLLLENEDSFVNSQSQAYYECITNNHIIEVLVKLTGTTKLIYELVQDSLPKAKQFKFYNILMNYSYYLLSYYSIKGDQKLFNKEQENYLKYMELARKEQYSKFLFYKSSVKLDNQSPITDELLNGVKIDLEEMMQLRCVLDSYEIDFYYFFLALEFYQKSNELGKIISICDEAESIMSDNTLAFTNTRKTIILFFRLNAYLSLKKFVDGIKLIKTEKALQISVNNYNWFLLKETEFKLFLHNNEINEAFNIYEEIIHNNSFKNQVDRFTEKWKIYHAYLVFLDNYLNKGDYKKFSLPKFLNSVPVNSKDKSGFNFAIRIIELLFQFARGEDAMVFHKMDALRVYRSRYLNDNTYKRNHLFLSLLLKSEKSGFDYKVLHKAEWQEIQDLRDRMHIIAEWEIIPYEELWDIFVELSKK